MNKETNIEDLIGLKSIADTQFEPYMIYTIDTKNDGSIKYIRKTPTIIKLGKYKAISNLNENNINNRFLKAFTRLVSSIYHDYEDFSDVMENVDRTQYKLQQIEKISLLFSTDEEGAIMWILKSNVRIGKFIIPLIKEGFYMDWHKANRNRYSSMINKITMNWRKLISEVSDVTYLHKELPQTTSDNQEEQKEETKETIDQNNTIFEQTFSCINDEILQRKEELKKVIQDEIARLTAKIKQLEKELGKLN